MPSLVGEDTRAEAERIDEGSGEHRVVRRTAFEVALQLIAMAENGAREQRDRFIASANAVARRRSTETRSLGRDKYINVSSKPEESPNSETSADELALDYNRP